MPSHRKSTCDWSAWVMRPIEALGEAHCGRVNLLPAKRSRACLSATPEKRALGPLLCFRYNYKVIMTIDCKKFLTGMLPVGPSRRSALAWPPTIEPAKRSGPRTQPQIFPRSPKPPIHSSFSELRTICNGTNHTVPPISIADYHIMSGWVWLDRMDSATFAPNVQFGAP